MGVLLTKSMDLSLTDAELEAKKVMPVRSMSFYAAIDLFQKKYNITDKLIGFQVTQDGINLIYE